MMTTTKIRTRMPQNRGDLTKLKYLLNQPSSFGATSSCTCIVCAEFTKEMIRRMNMKDTNMTLFLNTINIDSLLHF